MIEKDLIFIDEDRNSQKEVMGFLIDKLYDSGYINDKAGYRRELLNREQQIPTSIGFSIAMPHGICEAVNKPFIAFLRTKKEFIWDESVNEPVHMIFMIGVPKENTDNIHLKFISLISRKLMKEEFRERLHNSATAEEAYQILDEINQLM